MKFKTSNKRSAGFTLVEILAATAILVILLAVGMVSVVRYAKLLQITELDNAAREIYLAAENRAVLLTGSERVKKLVETAQTGELNAPAQADATPLAAGGTGGTVSKSVYIRYSGAETEEQKDLLPEGAIDPALRKGCFYVVYNVVYKDAGDEKAVVASVTDVFYDEDGTALPEGVDFNVFYGRWKGSSRQERLNVMVGYYGGEAAESGNSDALSTPKLEIVNGEELKVILTYTVPMGETRDAVVELTYRDATVDLNKLTGQRWVTETTVPDPLTQTVTYTYTWVLDTLDTSGHRFAELFTAGSKPAPGGDFTVTAIVADGTVESPAATATGNSLFANGSGETTAYIENLRHLQNLDRDHSKVEGKTAAVQTADIDCGESIFTGYEFVPIVNKQLKSYCGSSTPEGGGAAVAHFIKGLKVTDTSADGKPAAGLFATVTGESASNPWEFKDVRLINTEVEGKDKSTGNDLPAGALVGTAENASFDGCWVYWEMDNEAELRDYLTKNDGTLEYQITGSHAGGLAGELNGGTITDCLAATLVQGTTAGGLMGQSTGSVTVSRSYADCYITAPAAAGLIGDASGFVDLANVYAAGFIDNKDAAADAKAAGLWLGSESSTNTHHVYSVMSYEKVDGVEPLAPGVNADETNKCYYLGLNDGKSFEIMIGQDFRTGMGGEFRQVELADSHPYNLREGMALDVYPFPELKDLPHYGDWNTEFVKAALVYFEQYLDTGKTFVAYDPDGSYGFSGGGAQDSLKTGNDVVVPLDGYAVALQEEELRPLGDSFTISFTLRAADGTETKPQGDPISYTKANLPKVTVGTETYYLAALPDELINSDTAARDFYQILGFTVGAGTDTPTWSAYCPHFAKTARAMPKGVEVDAFAKSMAAAARNVQAYVRTPRHLRALSEFPAYSHAGKQEPQNQWTTYQYQFIQELNLDYKTYKGYGWSEKEYIQDPIGKSGDPFNGTYNGRSNTIRNVRFQLDESDNRLYAGLFGLTAGTLRNVVYMMDGDGAPVSVAKGRGERLYMGGLAGGNNGTIFNCAVAGAKLSGSVFGSTSVYVGGLAGMNAGQILNCAAEAAQLTANSHQYATAYAGGLVGQNSAGGTVRNSYAVGHVSATVDDTSTARVCGFVGHNSGAISDSYAAVWLESSGAGVETYGFCGEKQGTQSNTRFVNQGNFSYREQYYNATYEIREATKAGPIRYSALTAKGQPLTAMKLDGRAVEGNKDKAIFPLPTGVTDGNGKAVHYGRWPEELDLGTMGVYYWEKLELPTTEKDKKLEVYSVSMLRADGGKGTNEVTKVSTLSNARSDGGVVTDYGYGYYSGTGNTVTVTTNGIRYTANGGQGTELFDKNGKLSNNNAELDDVNGKLEELMAGYDFHSFRSFVPNPEPGKASFVEGTTKPGLYAKGITDKTGNLTTPNGRMTLKQDVVSITFEINPHFADALSVQSAPDGWTVADNLKTAPGQKDNPYEVRAMGQLSAINWNSTKRDTKTVLTSSNQTQFPYLSTSSDTGKYHWLQTHDLNGKGQTQTPIAEYYDSTNGNSGALSGWFGGTYEGDDYVIENINIQGQASSCAGLFGVVFQGKLSNIVMYSSDGNGVISTIANGGTDGKGVKTQSRWYAMGALAGMAGSSTIENCSAAGYTIEATVYTHGGGDAWGGNNIGGLIGATDGDLNGCAAVTEISVHDATENDNMRVGGLVGVCQGTISNCYAGGSISFGNKVTVQRDDRFIYVGGLVGGSYFKPLWVETVKEYVGIDPNDSAAKANTSNELENCYSYVVLPKPDAAGKKDDGKTQIRCLYALGGVGELQFGGLANSGTCTITNCYYLESEVMKNNPEGFDAALGLGTDIGNDDSVVQVVKGTDKDGKPTSTELKKPLTSDDVGKVFTIRYGEGTNSLTYNNHYNKYIQNVPGISGDQQSQCPFFGNFSTVTVGAPIFTFVDKNDEHSYTVPNTPGEYRVKFQGWATSMTPGRPTEKITLTRDPAALTGWSGPKAITYEELSGENDTFGIYGKLNKAIPTEQKKFAPVTDTATEEDFDIPGEYSYNTKAKPKLQGLRYPFPTILTREKGTIHVHYGDWPLLGIEREEGGAPIELNLFSANPSSVALKLSKGVTHKGTWKIVTDDNIATMKFEAPDSPDTPKIHTDTDGTCKLSVQGVKAGLEKMTVQYTETDGTKYTLELTVHVTTVLRVVPKLSPICLFPGGLTEVPLTLCDEQGNPLELTEEQMKNLKISTENSRCGSSELLETATLIEKDGEYYLKLRAVTPKPDEEQPEQKLPSEGLLAVNVWYTYPNEENEYFDLSTLSLRMVDLEPKQENNLVDGSVKLTFPALEWPVGQDTKTVAITVKDVGIAKVEKPDSSVQDDLPVVNFGESQNYVTLEDSIPGSKVTLSLRLGLKLEGAAVDTETVCTVELTVEIPVPPEPEPEPEPEQPGGENTVAEDSAPEEAAVADEAPREEPAPEEAAADGEAPREEPAPEEAAADGEAPEVEILPG